VKDKKKNHRVPDNLFPLSVQLGVSEPYLFGAMRKLKNEIIRNPGKNCKKGIVNLRVHVENEELDR
jgi:hypothetical protein